MPELHVNYKFVVNYALTHAGSGLILDYGCGSGEIVREGIRQGLNIYGCEAFYDGSHGVRGHVADLLGTRILEMPNGQIPFPDATFDCIVNNQVFEHVTDLD